MTEWLLTDLHIHITFSDGQSWQENQKRLWDYLNQEEEL
jgi:hypothetical protein